MNNQVLQKIRFYYRLKKFVTDWRIQHKVLAFFSFCVFILLLYTFFSAYINTNNPHLVISHNDSSANGGPITIIDLGSNEKYVPLIKAVGCGGIAKLDYKNHNTIHVYCVGSTDDTVRFDMDLRTSDITKSKPLPEPYTNPMVPIFPTLLETDELRIFSDGGPTTPTTEGYLTNAGIVLYDSRPATSKVYISDRTKSLFISKIVIDPESNIAFLMSTGDGVTVLIDKIDLLQKKVTDSYVIKSYSGYDMIEVDENIAVTTYRTTEGNDVIILSKSTLQVVKQLQIPLENNAGYNAYSLLEHKGRLFVSVLDGLLELDPDSFEIVSHIKNNLGSYFTTLILGHNYIYAIDAYDSVIQIPFKDLYHTKNIFEATNQGLTNLFYIHN